MRGQESGACIGMLIRETELAYQPQAGHTPLSGKPTRTRPPVVPHARISDFVDRRFPGRSTSSRSKRSGGRR